MRDCARPVYDIFPAFLPIRTVGIVRIIYIALPGQHLAEFPEDGQTAYARVENTYHTSAKIIIICYLCMVLLKGDDKYRTG